jgi:signal transduction histidine kinase
MVKIEAQERRNLAPQPGLWAPSSDWPEIDLGLLLRVYSWLAWLTGAVYCLWGPMWLGTDLPGLPWHKAALIRVLGAILFASGCAAFGLARVDEPLSRRRGLLWLTIGHFVVAVIVATQNVAIWDRSRSNLPMFIPWVAVMLLFLFYSVSGGRHVFGEVRSLFSSSPGPQDRVRSQYEQQIRATAAQEERNRLARDLHDSIKQQIFVMQTAAATAEARFQSDPVGVREALALVRNAAREAMTEMQAMLDQLRAAPLENASLVEALKAQCEALGFRTGANARFELGSLPPNDALPPGAHETLLRAAQEALANVGRHARASNVDVRLGIARRKLVLEIRDDGSGFDTNQNKRGMGIGNMRARAQELGGELELISAPGRGTSVTIAIPYAVPKTAKELKREMLSWLVPAALTLGFGLRLPDMLSIALGVFFATASAVSCRAWLRARKANRNE